MTRKNNSVPAPAHDASQPMGLAYLVGRLDHVLNRRLRDSLSPLGLTVPQYTALSVFRAQGSLSNAQLAERTMVTPQSANEMVKMMETRGWIERKPDPSHGRIIQISLTDEGNAILHRGDFEVRKVELLMFPDVKDEGRAQLRVQLRAAVRALTLDGT